MILSLGLAFAVCRKRAMDGVSDGRARRGRARAVGAFYVMAAPDADPIPTRVTGQMRANECAWLLTPPPSLPTSC